MSFTRIIQHVLFAACISLFALVLLQAPATAQVNTYLDETGVPTFTTAMPVEAGFINLANGNMHLEIPIASYPQRGKTSYSARMAFESRVWRINPNAINGGPQWQPAGGWNFIAGGAPGFVSYTYSQTNPICQKGTNRYQTTKYQGFSWQEASVVDLAIIVQRALK